MSTQAQQRRTVVVLGQTPPPWHGQAVIIDQLVHARYQALQLVHVRMAFSETHEQLGRVSLRKLTHLPSVLARAAFARIRHRASVLYYPPAGAALVPVLRDIALLLCLRPLFRHTVFHVHAAGTARIESELPRWLRPLFRRAYHGASLAIVPCAELAQDTARLNAKSSVVIPHGLRDAAGLYLQVAARMRSAVRPTSMLYVGMLCASKGVSLLVEALGELRARGLHATLTLVGAFESARFRAELEQRIEQLGLGDRVELCGVRSGEAKWQTYAAADLLCFPTFYDAETFGLVALEAMQFELPVVATRFRALPSIVEHESTGLLVAPNDLAVLTAALERLARDPELRRAMGRRGRERYLARFGHERFVHDMEAALRSL